MRIKHSSGAVEVTNGFGDANKRHDVKMCCFSHDPRMSPSYQAVDLETMRRQYREQKEMERRRSLGQTGAEKRGSLEVGREKKVQRETEMVSQLRTSAKGCADGWVDTVVNKPSESCEKKMGLYMVGDNWTGERVDRTICWTIVE